MDVPLRILAVDNEPSIILSMRFVFDGPRYELTCVGNGNAALARLDANSNLYDVIIVDQKMPGLTGLELVKAIKVRGISGKIIVVSAYLDPELRQGYERMGVDTMFSKPFSVEELRSAVDRVMV
jgi:two-component system response regulator (stage 0 sporulation protein F)